MDTNMKFAERNFKLDYRKAKSNSRTVPVVLSSDKPYDRGDYTEVLVHRADTINLEREPLPLIEAHDRSKTNIGIVENLSIQSGKLRGTARFGTSARANELWDDIEAGIVRSVSIGYEIHDYDEDHSTNPPTMNVTRFTPFELSITSTPADTSAGFFRNLNRDKNMETNTSNTEHTSRSQRRSEKRSSEDELNRIEGIRSIGNDYDLQELGERLISNGSPLDAMQGAALEIIGERNSWITQTDEYGNETNVRNFGSIFSGQSVHTDSRTRQFDTMNALQMLITSAAGLGYSDMGPYMERSQELARITGQKPKHGGILIPLGDMQERALTVGGTGSSAVQEDIIAGSFIDLLRAKSAVMSLGPTVMNGLVGNAAIPRKTAGTTGYWVDLDDTDSITESTIALDQVSLSFKSVAGYTKYSHQMLMQSALSVEQMIREDLAAMLASALDVAAIQGTGASGQPTGIVNTTGINETTYSTSPTYADIVEMEGAILADNVDMAGSIAYLTTPTLSTALKTTEKASGTAQYVWEAKGGSEGIMNGYRSIATANVPAGSVILGKWSDLLIGTWGTLELLIDPYSEIQKGTVGVRAIMDTDIATRNPSSFCEMTSE